MPYRLLPLLLLLLPPSLWAKQPPLTMAFNQRPPYHYVVGSQHMPQGMLSDILIRVLYDADLKVEFVEMPVHRILAETKKDWPFCSFTWFKNAERSRFAKFSLPLWKDTPFVLVTHRRNKKKFSAYPRLDLLLKNSQMSLGSKIMFSYGPYIDRLLDDPQNRMRIERLATPQSRIIQLLDERRFDAVLLTPEERIKLFESAGVDYSQYVSIEYLDVPEGERRHIMCSRAVSDRTIERLNRSIRKLAPSFAFE